GRTMLPARFVAEALGGVVTWDEAEQKVTIVKDGSVIEIFIGEPFATVDGEPVELDCAAYIENDRTYLPLRFIAENLGAEVVWDAVQRTVTITP
ncbi:MAG: copper amine oxidase N-terminal domain-containing protein, partial [Anaerotignum sp.]|nr:copper amine oxidase N-terminal domain-containing protein [Anaerotignum sp.]